MRRADPKTQELKRLISKIRRHPKYKKWRSKVLHQDGWTDKDKNIQAHHKKEISKLIEKYGIKDVEDAIKCTELWKTSLGITLSRGEHFIMTKLRRYKYLTEGFIKLLEEWLAECKSRPRKVSKGN